MRRQTRKFWIVAALAILTNGYSLLGLAQGSAGALARTIECNQAMVRALAANLALKLQSGTPPARPQRWIPERFILDCRPETKTPPTPGGWRRSHGAGPAQAPVGWRATKRIIHSATTVPW